MEMLSFTHFIFCNLVTFCASVCTNKQIFFTVKENTNKLHGSAITLKPYAIV